MSSLDFTLLDIPSSVKEIVINVGSNLDPLLPSKEMGPCAHTIAIEPSSLDVKYLSIVS